MVFKTKATISIKISQLVDFLICMQWNFLLNTCMHFFYNRSFLQSISPNIFKNHIFHFSFFILSEWAVFKRCHSKFESSCVIFITSRFFMKNKYLKICYIIFCRFLIKSSIAAKLYKRCKMQNMFIIYCGFLRSISDCIFRFKFVLSISKNIAKYDLSLKR